MKIVTTCILIAIAAAALTACSEDAPPSPSAAPQVTETETMQAPVTAQSVDSGAIGIAECDTFLQKYEACMAKMSDKNRASYTENLTSFREQYKELAANDAVKAQLPERCEADQAELSPSLIADFGCEF